TSQLRTRYLRHPSRCNISQNFAYSVSILSPRIAQGAYPIIGSLSDNREHFVAIDFNFTNAFTQEARHLRIQTGLADDLLLLRRFHCVEGISRLFQFELDLLSPSGDIKPQDIVGDNVSITVQPENEPPRFFNGFVKSFQYLGL